jgi:hypothetical protein
MQSSEDQPFGMVPATIPVNNNFSLFSQQEVSRGQPSPTHFTGVVIATSKPRTIISCRVELKNNWLKTTGIYLDPFLQQFPRLRPPNLIGCYASPGSVCTPDCGSFATVSELPSPGQRPCDPVIICNHYLIYVSCNTSCAAAAHTPQLVNTPAAPTGNN